MIDRFWRPTATLLVATGVIAMVIVLPAPEWSKTFLALLGIITFAIGWTIFIVVRDR